MDTKCDNTTMGELGSYSGGICIDSAVSSDEQDSQPLIELRLTANRGCGLFAIEKIPAGTIIVDEPPLVKISTAARAPAEAICILNSVDHLARDRLDSYNSLHCVKNKVDSSERAVVRAYLTSKQYSGELLEIAFSEYSQTVAVFNTNGVSLGERGEHGSGVFEWFSRCNHSCTPNVEHYYDDLTNNQMLLANRDVKVGEELTISYIKNLHATPGERAEALSRWCFQCDCEACDGTEAHQHTKRRERMAENFKILDKSKANSTNPKTALKCAEELVELCLTEQLLGADLLIAYKCCTELAYDAGELTKAIELCQRWRGVEEITRGPNYKSLALPWLERLEDPGLLNDRRFRREVEKVQKEKKNAERKAEKQAAKETKKANHEEAKRKEEEEKRLEAFRAQEAELLKQRKDAAEKAERKKAKGSANNAVKKAKRTIRAPAKDDKELAPRIDAMLNKIGGEEILALANRMTDASNAKCMVLDELTKAAKTSG